MPIPIAAIPVAISAINKILSLREQADSILSQAEATAALPFALPAPPKVDFARQGKMLQFFRQPENQHVLDVIGLREAFESFGPHDPEGRKQLLIAYEEYSGQVPPALAGDRDETLAWMMVGSSRLARNPPALRLALAIARSAAEFAGENAQVFVNSPRTQGIVRTLLIEFSKDPNLDDRALGVVARRLVGAAVSAAIDNPDALPKRPALSLLYASLEELRQEVKGRPGAAADAGTDFVARIITWEGFEDVVATYIRKAPDDARFVGVLDQITGISDLDDDDQTELANLLRGGLKALLEQTGNAIVASDGVDELLRDPKALVGVLEGTIGVMAGNAEAVIGMRFKGQPLVAGLLQTVAATVAAEATALPGDSAAETARRSLFAKVATGTLFGSLFKASLATIAANPDLVRSRLDIDDARVEATVARLIGGIAGSLANLDPATWDTGQGREALRSLIAGSLGVLADDPRLLRVRGGFAEKVVSDLLGAAAALVRDGLAEDDALDFVRAALETTSGNLGLVQMDDRLRATVVAFGRTLAAENALERLGDPKQGAALVLEALTVVAANPDAWQGFEQRGLVQPLAVGLLAALIQATTDPDARLRSILTGPTLVAVYREVLAVLTRHGRERLADVDRVAQLQRAIVVALAHAEAAVGVGIDGHNLRLFLRRVTIGFLTAQPPIMTAETPARVDAIAAGVLMAMIEAERRDD